MPKRFRHIEPRLHWVPGDQFLCPVEYVVYPPPRILNDHDDRQQGEAKNTEDDPEYFHYK